MDNAYSTREVTIADADRLYPLIRLAVEGLPLEAWRTFVAATAKQKNPSVSRGMHGIVAVECERGYARGLFTYTVVTSLTCGRTLECDNLIVLDQFGVRSIQAAILDSLRELAHRNQCESVHINVGNVGGNPPELIDALRHAGFMHDQDIWCRQKDAAN